MRMLENKVAVITGGTSGIGAGCAELFLAEGARVVIAGRRAAEGQALVARLGGAPAIAFRQTDVTEEAQVQGLLAEVVATHGRLDCLVNNAGTPSGMAGIEAFDAAQFDRLIAVHLRGCMLGMKHAAGPMRRQGGGSIVNIGSMGGHLPGVTGHAYAAVKAAVIHATRCVARELGEDGVRVNSISPGAIVTGIFAKGAGLPDTEAEAEAGLQALAARFAGLQPIARAGLPIDVARAAAWLCSDLAGFVNGEDIRVDGGFVGGYKWSELQAQRAAFSRR